MIIVDFKNTMMIHFENIVVLEVLPVISSNAVQKSRLIVTLADETTLVLGEYESSYAEYLFSGILSASIDEVKILYLPESENAAGIAVGGKELKGGAALWGMRPSGSKIPSLKETLLDKASKKSGGIFHEKAKKHRSN